MSELSILSRPEWQMSLGERAALEGVVSELRPRLAIEIGTAEGGSLSRIAAHSEEVHSIDLDHDPLVERPENVALHTGDSKVLLPKLLAELAAEDREVEFVLVDGDHSSEGARADLSALLDSPAIRRTMILVHDSFHVHVRAGIEAAGLADSPKVLGFDLDFVPGRLAKLGSFEDQLLGGFALVIVDEDAAASGEGFELGLWSLRPDPILFHDSHAAIHRGAALIDSGGEARPEATPQIQLDLAHLEGEDQRRAQRGRAQGPPRGGRARARLRGAANRVRRLTGRLSTVRDDLLNPDAGADSARHWQRIVLNRAVDDYIAELPPARCRAAEISGESHADKPWREYSSLMHPEFDLAAPLEAPGTYDVVICEQVLEHIADLRAAVANLRGLCAPGGHVIVSTPFLVRVHELAMFGMRDYWRFTPNGIRTLLEDAGLEVESVGSWGNHKVVEVNFRRWSAYRPWHSLRNEPDLPIQVWAFARNPAP